MSLKGPTKTFFDDENLDRLFSMTIALGAEISALSEKLDVVLSELQRHNLLSAAEMDAHVVSPEEQVRRDTARQRMVETLLLPFRDAADALASQMTT